MSFQNVSNVEAWAAFQFESHTTTTKTLKTWGLVEYVHIPTLPFSAGVMLGVLCLSFLLSNTRRMNALRHKAHVRGLGVCP